MQIALNFTPALFSGVPASSSGRISTVTKLTNPAVSRVSPIRATAAHPPAAAYDTPTVDYSSSMSVFPAEACETIGGDACIANIYPEVKLKPENTRDQVTRSESVDRDYLDYTAYQKTVLLGEACDVLGGEFCQRPYQRGIY